MHTVCSTSMKGECGLLRRCGMGLCSMRSGRIFWNIWDAFAGLKAL